MATDSNQEGYEQVNGQPLQRPKVLALGLVSAVSAIAGGLAVAWWYRNTITKLQNPIAPKDQLLEDQHISESEISSSDT